MYQNQRFPGSCITDGYDLALAKQSVGPGWHAILERLFLAKPDWIKVIQVKEKFGGLRFYLDDGTVRVDFIGTESGTGSFALPAEQGRFDADRSALLQAFRQVVQESEVESFTVCEDCGAPGSRKSGGWIRTLCDQCHGKKNPTN